MPKDEINVNFNITSGMGREHLLTLPFLKTATINDFVGNQKIRDYTPENKTPKFVYKTKILKSEDTLENIGYNSEEKLAAITVVYVSNRNDMTNYVFINVKPDGSEIIKSIMIDKKITFDELKVNIKQLFEVSEHFKLKNGQTDIESTQDLFKTIISVPIIVDDSIENPLKGGRRRRSSTPRKSSSSRRSRSTKRRTTSRKQQKRRRGSRRAH